MSTEQRNRDKKVTGKSDLPDTERDQEKLEGDEATIQLPDVKEIPGQEFIHPPHLREFADTTISSADEEGENVWMEQPLGDGSSEVTEVEKTLLDRSANDMPTTDDQQLRRAELDSVDNEGDPLNEKATATAISGSDLDVPGADEDNPDEEIGEEDEENNPYSLGGDNNSVNEERSGA